MVKVKGPQEIPSELLDGYRASLVEILPDTSIRHRYPYRVPPQQTEVGHPSPLQLIHRAIFRKGCRCYNIQPYEGGVEPPDQGPRNRSWWFTEAIPSGFWYYNYFMQQTINQYLLTEKVKWCWVPVSQDAEVDEVDPDTNYGGMGAIGLAAGVAGLDIISFIGKDNPLTRQLYYRQTYLGSNGYKFAVKVGLYLVIGAWDEGTITWNNKPELGKLISYKWCINDTIHWARFDVPKAYMGETSFALKIVSIENYPPGEYVNVSFDSKENVHPENRPYWT